MPEKTQSLNRSSFSIGARISAALLCLPSFFTINKTIEAVFGVLLIILFWLLGDRRKNILRSARGVIYLTPGLIIVNSLLRDWNGKFGLTINGAVVGLDLSLRLLWTFLLVTVLFQSAPLDEMIALFRSIFRFLHLPEKEWSETVTMTLTLLPDFASLPVKGFRNLPEAIAERIAAAENRIKIVCSSGLDVQGCPNQQPRIKNQGLRFRPIDLALLLPAALFLIFTIIT
ncbi:MAG: hypothetical protein ABIK47_07765 [candidate division WOR-3 bacterium]